MVIERNQFSTIGHEKMSSDFDANSVFESTPTPYLILNPDFTIAGANDAYLKATSTKREAIVGRGIFDVFPDNPHDPEASGVKNLSSSLRQVLLEKRPLRMATQKYDIPDPEHPGSFIVRYWSPQNFPVLDETKTKVRYIIHQVEDVTDSVLAKKHTDAIEAEIEERKIIEKALGEAIRDREMFFSIASHELKNPLAAMNLQVQKQLRTIERNPMDTFSIDQIKQTMEGIQKQSKKLVSLVDEMLDISRITSGKLELNLKNINLCELLVEVVNRLIPQFEEAKVSPPSIELCKNSTVSIDPMRIEQVITNLLTNALRYGEGKPILIRLESLDSEIRLSIKDHGMGIVKEMQDKIFNRFERATESNKGKGLGLGLYITKEIVKAHGGHIWVESEPGKGSTFFVSFS